MTAPPPDTSRETLRPGAEAAAAALAGAALVVDRQGQVLFANAAVRRVLAADPAGRPLASLVENPPHELAAQLELWLRCRTPVPGSLVFRTPQGERRPMRCDAGTIGRGAERSGLVLLQCRPRGEAAVRFRLLTERVDQLAREVRERRRVQAELEARAAELLRSNADLEQFAYVASHDLQEPLRSVSMFSDLALSRLGEGADPQVAEYLRLSQAGARRMQDLVRDLLEYSRVTRVAHERRVVDATEVVDAVLADLRLASVEAGAEITREPLPVLLADAALVGRVFHNLISNAIKFRSEERPPRVHVSAAAADAEEFVELAVRDNGIGIDPRHARTVFAIFQRLHPRDRYPGTGIGLALCKRIVERHGGRIWFDSRPGAGATFRFTLPRAT